MIFLLNCKAFLFYQNMIIFFNKEFLNKSLNDDNNGKILFDLNAKTN